VTTLVLTVIGDDQSGLVDALSGVITDHGGSWDESHMTQLAGKFAGIVLVTVPAPRVEELIDSLAPLEARGLLDITAERALGDDGVVEARRLSLELVGQDHPGIVHDISQALAARGVGIIDLQTETKSAPMSGGTLFEATAVLEVPEEVSLAELYDSLEALANELMVDLDIRQD
jgi:glycine cleavage system regulatory protein